ncbi:RagB/SusD family nutrient uptake outer membrane protein [Chryseobacterium sp. CFBP8996]|uniref:RagB/SusD family nutrient uptake outer membrane protein n=1 Tax=Chryseobacterium sp. CFBP8996 TaxID=3096529 RepID=UPI002A6AD78F|nr:RagB/SusD family nutrient uptake outer membrane protein [Chryseobacterium sp. CFBP8996]MDY0929493.1 RagB/SusD family nutrient uptake outer membrane protein [Chryseobacterium sp. CFBP8996]
MKKYIIALSLATMVGFSITSCSEDFIETDFGNSVQAEQLKSIEELQAFMNGTYGSMRSTGYYGANYPMYAEIRSDEMFSRRSSGYFQSVANLSMTSVDQYATTPYNAIYAVVAKTNIILNSPNNLTWTQTQNAATISDKVDKIKAEAYTMRALAFFDLLKLYGQQYSGGTKGIVIPTKYDPKANMARASVTETQAQIESDFTNALALMSGNQFNTPGNKTEINELSLKALMSRYYLYKGDYAKVRQYVAQIVAANRYSVTPKDSYVVSWTLNNASSNSIFELAVGNANAYGAGGINAFMNLNGAYRNVGVLASTYNLYTASDVRRSAETFGTASGYRFIVHKYPAISGSDNLKLVRYEEVLLNGVEAELAVNGGNQTIADTYYNLIGANRITGYTDVTGVTLAQLKTERRKELLGEGFRMWDLLRWGQSVPVYNSTGAALTATLNIGDTRLAFPIPQAETNVSGTLVTSNPGYDN